MYFVTCVYRGWQFTNGCPTQRPRSTWPFQNATEWNVALKILTAAKRPRSPARNLVSEIGKGEPTWRGLLSGTPILTFYVPESRMTIINKYESQLILSVSWCLAAGLHRSPISESITNTWAWIPNSKLSLRNCCITEMDRDIACAVDANVSGPVWRLIQERDSLIHISEMISHILWDMRMNNPHVLRCNAITHNSTVRAVRTCPLRYLYNCWDVIQVGYLKWIQEPEIW